MTDEIYINYGGEWLDVDDNTFGGFDTSTLWDFKDPATRGKSRSLDLSVPATVKNTKIFNYYKLLPGDGVRRGINGAVTAGGKVINGVIFVTKYSGGRYSIMIAYGRTFGGFTGNYNAIADVMTYNSTDVPATSGAIPDFGWYDYENFMWPHSIIGGLTSMFPSTNIGHIIDCLAAAEGYAVSYPDPSLGRQYQAHAYGLVLPSFGLRGTYYQIDITGSAYFGYNANVIGGTLADAGLVMDTAFYRRGQISEDVKVNVFRTTRMLHVHLPANSGLCLVGHQSSVVYNDWEGTKAANITFDPNARFSIVKANENHKSGNNYYWNRNLTPKAFEGSVSVSLQVNFGSFEMPNNGDTMYLRDALPVRSLEEWLDMYCNLIAGVWTVDDATHTITIKTYKELINAAYNDTDHHLSLENEEVISIDSVTRYVDGFAQHNYTKTTDDRYIRDLRCVNDYLSASNNLAEIDADAGEQGGTSDPSVTTTYIEDVRKDENGAMVYDGKLTVFFENTATTDGARHVMDTLSMGVGEDVQSIVSNGSSVVVKVRMPYFKYANINHLTCANLHGRNFVVQKAKWDNGVAQLDMLDVGKVLPQMQYNWLNFEMPNGGDITLTRVGNPTAVVLEYSLDNGSTWTEWVEVGNVRTLTLAAGGRVWLRNQSETSTGFSTSQTNYYQFGFSDNCNAYGDTRSLLCKYPYIGSLTNFVFCRLFMNCNKLLIAPQLEAKTLTRGCYSEMFYGCTSLVNAPSIQSVNLADTCYADMFRGCSSLVTAPNLPATTLVIGCYEQMFYGCTSLVNAPSLPATTLKRGCYDSMFYGCSSLVSAPELPATLLPIECYQYMFKNCSSLVNAPILPAKQLNNYCYNQMFYGCSLLSEITMLATDISATNCLNNWLYNVAAAGTLHTDSRLTGIPRDSASGIPTGWNREDIDPWLNFEMPNGGDIKLKRNGSPTPVTLEYSLDGGLNWSEWVEVNGVRTLTLQAGGRVWLRNQSAASTGFSTSSADYYSFAFTDAVYAYGDTRSLLCSDVQNAVIVNYVFSRLFYGCTSLITAPRLDAANIAQNCYMSMFSGCSSLVTAPNLLAMSLATYCYGYMFHGCTALAVAPELASSQTSSNCYRSMFQNCTSLVVAPVLKAPTIHDSSYRRMFYGCSSLNLVVLHATTASSSLCTYQWLTGVAATGDIYCPQSLVFTSTDGGVPSGWTRHDL